jgi:hypothetical protein
MRHCIEQSNGLVPSLLCRSWVDCIIATRGYDFRKGQVCGCSRVRLRLWLRVLALPALVWLLSLPALLNAAEGDYLPTNPVIGEFACLFVEARGGLPRDRGPRLPR